MDRRGHIVKLIDEMGVASGRDLIERLGISRQALNRHLQQLIREGRVAKSGTTRNARYTLPRAGEAGRTAGRRFRKQYVTAGLAEDRVFRELSLFLGLGKAMSHAALETFQYALTEIVNNAVDHSRAPSCFVSGSVEDYQASFVVRDKGIGIFRSIVDKFSLVDETDAVVELQKGKRTSQPDRHAGEGIYFTSKCADRMEILSHRIRLVYDNVKGDVFVEETTRRAGTTVSFELRRRTRRRLASLFSEYAPEDFDFSFGRTRIRAKLVNQRYASRSEAKRLLSGLDRFREVVLDFRGVAGIGQGFADEIFRVFAAAHPEIILLCENTNELVSRMIEHARHPET